MLRPVRSRSAKVVLLAVALACAWFSLGQGATPGPALAATFTVNSTADGVDASIGNGVCETSTSGQCTLRAAIQEANFGAAYDVINFSITGAGVHTLTPATNYPDLTTSMLIDATSEPGYAGSPLIEVSGGGQSGAAFTIKVSTFATVQGFIINGFTAAGVQVMSGGHGIIVGNWIGLNDNGTALANGRGIHISQSGSDATIGSTASFLGNVISGNTGSGIEIVSTGSSSTLIQSNKIGTNVAGTAALPNGGDGIDASANVTIGGTILQRNVISGNTGDGIVLNSGVTDGSVLRNYIGRNATNTGALGNGIAGIRVMGATDVEIGAIDAGNIIANNGSEGVRLLAGSDDISMRGNSIYANGLAGIDMTGGANSSIGVPTITGIAPLQGTTTGCATCSIDIYSDSSDEGQVYHATVTAVGGAWTYYGQIDGPNVTATQTNTSGDTSEFSGAFAKGACGAVCSEGFWHVTYTTGGFTRSCSTWINQVAGTYWGHLSCTDGTQIDLTGTIAQVGSPPYAVTTASRQQDNGVLCANAFDDDFPGDGLVNDGCPTVGAPEAGGSCGNAVDDDADLAVNDGCPASGLPEDDFRTSATGTTTGSASSGTWVCTVGCPSSGTWTGTLTSLVDEITIGPGGTGTFGTGTPATSIYNPSGQTITVKAVSLTDLTGNVIARTGYDFGPDGATFPSSPIELTVDFSGTQLAIPNDNCWGMALEFQNPATLAWEFDKLVDCQNGSVDEVTVEIDHFSVARFAFCAMLPITDTTTPNFDRNFIELGSEAPYDDVTRAYSDSMPDNAGGSGCGDPDDDNDGRADEEETSGMNCGNLGTRVTNPFVADSDGDYILDGPECDRNFDPTLSSSKPTPTDCGGSGDQDNDGLNDHTETCRLYTDYREADTDRYVNARNTNGTFADVCNDLKETGSINADTTVSSTDLGQVAQRFGSSTGPNYSVFHDVNKDGTIGALDLGRVAAGFGGCPPI